MTGHYNILSYHIIKHSMHAVTTTPQHLSTTLCSSTWTQQSWTGCHHCQVTSCR